MEEIQERVTHRPDFGQYQFGGIGRPLSRSAQSGLTQPLGEGLARSFGGSFYFCQFLGSQSRGRGLGAEAGLRLFSERQTGLWISLNAGTTHWTNRLVALLRLIPLRLNCAIVSSQEALALQRVYASRYSGATFRKQTSLFDISVTQQLTNFVDAAKVNLRKRRSFIWRSAVPKLGVTCPHFFRCEAPRSYNSPYSRASASHRRRTCGACHARRNSFLMDCQSSPRKLNVIPLSPARKFTPISSFSSATVYARK